MTFQPGQKVVAKKLIEDEGVAVAERGDVGTVLDPSSDAWANVRFERTGRVSICHISEIEAQQ